MLRGTCYAQGNVVTEYTQGNSVRLGKRGTCRVTWYMWYTQEMWYT